MKSSRMNRLLHIFKLSIREDNSIVKKLNNRVRVYNRYNKMMKRWLMLYQDNISICDYFGKYNLETISIYGMGDIGHLLLRECGKRGINVQYAIDRDANCKSCNVPIFYPNVSLPKVDCIVLTTFTGTNELKECIEAQAKCKVIPFEEILDDVTQNVYIKKEK